MPKVSPQVVAFKLLRAVTENAWKKSNFCNEHAVAYGVGAISIVDESTKHVPRSETIYSIACIPSIIALLKVARCLAGILWPCR